MMIRILNYSDRLQHASLFQQMFQGRARTFSDRLGWKVSVEQGMECDLYDTLPSVHYLVATDTTETVIGSLRLLPTTGEIMLRKEFAAYFDGLPDFLDPATWECTRFCTHLHEGENPGAWTATSADLLISLCEFSMGHGIERIVGVYEAPMARIYRRIGWSPREIARHHSVAGDLLVGVWHVSREVLGAMRERRMDLPKAPAAPIQKVSPELFSYRSR
jgi:N-acyl-L-homoserine lactone synthetase